ncbi:tyrosine recombinase [Plakobranchus ocellatus]|uniref:Tyrosine recombinase n=1 Tax=Plakobranchus ocellatus TaxID=259542 RepID=A0AAV4D9V0_9GAST|nr:tyrosine recombinase [Plakobranchus ocellatus]
MSKPKAVIKTDASSYAWGAFMNNSIKETSRRRDRKNAGGDSKLENANLVPQVNKDDDGQAHSSKTLNKTRFSPLGSGGSSSITSKTKSDGLRLIREKMKTLVVILSAYRQDRRICVYTCLKQYLKRTKLLRSSSQVFVSTQSLHDGVSKDTLARWLRLNTRIFKAHSTRAAASSVAARGMDISHVLQTAGWSSETTFAKFYNRTTECGRASTRFATSVLDSKSVSLKLKSQLNLMNIKQDDRIDK